MPLLSWFRAATRALGSTMGGSASSSLHQGQTSDLFVDAVGKFTIEERQVLPLLFSELVSHSRDEGGHPLHGKIDKNTFLKIFHLPGVLGERMFAAFDIHNSNSIDYVDFVCGLGRVVRGSPEERLRFVFSMFDLGDDGQVSPEELFTTLYSLIEDAFRLLEEAQRDSPAAEAALQSALLRLGARQLEDVGEEESTERQQAILEAGLDLPSVYDPQGFSNLSGVRPPVDSADLMAAANVAAEVQGSRVEDIVLTGDLSPEVNTAAFSRAVTERLSFSGAAAEAGAHDDPPATATPGAGESAGSTDHRTSSGPDQAPLTSQTNGDGAKDLPNEATQHTPVLSGAGEPHLVSGRRGDSIRARFRRATSVNGVMNPETLKREIEQHVKDMVHVAFEQCSDNAAGLDLAQFRHFIGDNPEVAEIIDGAFNFATSSPGSAPALLDSLLAPKPAVCFAQQDPRMRASWHCGQCDLVIRVQYCYKCAEPLLGDSDCCRCSKCGARAFSSKPKFCFRCGSALSEMRERSDSSASHSRPISPSLGPADGSVGPHAQAGDVPGALMKSISFDSSTNMGSYSGRHRRSHTMSILLQRQHVRHVEKTGILFKRGRHLHTLQQRFFRIHDSFLYEYRKREDKSPTHVYLLEGTVIELLEATNKGRDEYGFSIGDADNDHSRKMLWAKTPQDRDEWVDVLRKAARSYALEDFYTLGEKIGEGQFAKIYRATSKRTRKPYAVKVISRANLAPNQRDQMRKEIAVLKLVHHPNIVHIVDVFEGRESISLVMNLVEGGDLLERIRKLKRYREGKARLLMWKLLEAVRYLHDRGIVHRDLKPENILVASTKSDVEIRVADFGLSTFATTGQEMRAMVGTLCYVAPEVLAGLKYTVSVDMWSCGVIMYVLLRGKLPFSGRDQRQIVQKTLKDQLVFPSKQWGHISDAAKELLKKLLCRDASKRLTVHEAQLHPWFDAIRMEHGGDERFSRVRHHAGRSGGAAPAVSGVHGRHAHNLHPHHPHGHVHHAHHNHGSARHAQSSGMARAHKQQHVYKAASLGAVRSLRPSHAQQQRTNGGTPTSPTVEHHSLVHHSLHPPNAGVRHGAGLIPPQSSPATASLMGSRSPSVPNLVSHNHRHAVSDGVAAPRVADLDALLLRQRAASDATCESASDASTGEPDCDTPVNDPPPSMGLHKFVNSQTLPRIRINAAPSRPMSASGLFDPASGSPPPAGAGISHTYGTGAAADSSSHLAHPPRHQLCTTGAGGGGALMGSLANQQVPSASTGASRKGNSGFLKGLSSPKLDGKSRNAHRKTDNPIDGSGGELPPLGLTDHSGSSSPAALALLAAAERAHDSDSVHSHVAVRSSVDMSPRSTILSSLGSSSQATSTTSSMLSGSSSGSGTDDAHSDVSPDPPPAGLIPQITASSPELTPSRRLQQQQAASISAAAS